MELENLDVTKIFYPVLLLIFGWYIVSNVYRLFGEWAGNPMMYVYTVVWTLVPVALIYAFWRGYKLRLKRSRLFFVGIALVAVFTADAVFEFATMPLQQIMLTGTWDHTFFPIAFGLLFLCDLSVFDKRFWWILVPFALFNLMPNLNVVANILFETHVIPEAPGFFNFFGVSTWAELWLVENFAWHFMLYLFEQLTFFTLFPGVIFYQLRRGSGV